MVVKVGCARKRVCEKEGGARDVAALGRERVQAVLREGGAHEEQRAHGKHVGDGELRHVVQYLRPPATPCLRSGKRERELHVVLCANANVSYA